MFADRTRYRRDATAPRPTGGLLLAPRATWVFVLAGITAGCSVSPRSEPELDPHRTTTEFSYRTSADGLEIAVGPYTDPDRVERRFGLNLLSHQIIPFEIVFANRGAPGGFLLQPESAVLTDERGLEALEFASSDTGVSHPDPLAPRTVGSFFQMFSPLTGLLLSSVALTMEEGYRSFRDVSRRMESLAYSDRPLYPTDSNRGFVYLKLTDVAELRRIDAIVFQARNVQSRQDKIIVVSLKER